MCQANQSLFWSYYYSTLAVVILLLLIKSNPRHFEDNFDSFQVTNTPLSSLHCNVDKTHCDIQSWAWVVLCYCSAEVNPAFYCLECLAFHHTVSEHCTDLQSYKPSLLVPFQTGDILLKGTFKRNFLVRTIHFWMFITYESLSCNI